LAGRSLQNREAAALGNRFAPDLSYQEGKGTDEKKAGHKKKIPARAHGIIKEESCYMSDYLSPRGGIFFRID